jgi:CheY-like chemotaxis protein/HPt (histidine-containing phosphotransfer) domain-containing protein
VLSEQLERAQHRRPTPVGEGKPTKRSLRILLAEDNLVNQALAARLLENHGHHVVIAANGRQALQQLDNENFDLVLMDVQMPDMDGFEATATIRKKEETTGTHIPVIAMTAYALQGDKERCLAAGMDVYLAKPIAPGRLIDAIQNLSQSAAFAEVAPTAERRKHEPIDTQGALTRVGGNVDHLKELVALFLKELPGQMSRLKEAMSAGDADALERAAHKIKGSVGNFSAYPAFQAASRLEVLGREANLSEAEPAYLELETEISRLKSAMANLSGLEVRL